MDKAKATVALYTAQDSTVNATLFLNASDKPRAPVFGGKIGAIAVSAFVRNEGVPGKRPFLSFVDKDNNQIATANAVLTKRGRTPILAAKVGEQEVWIHVRKQVPVELLARLGIDPAKIGAKDNQAAQA